VETGKECFAAILLKSFAEGRACELESKDGEQFKACKNAW